MTSPGNDNMEETAPVGPEEQVDLDEDNDSEEMLDEDIDEPAEEEPPEGIESSVRDGYAEEQDSEVEGQGKVTTTCASDADVSVNNDEIVNSSKAEVDIEKHAELLALPPHGSEIFIGGLPREATEEDLRGLCEPIGDIFEVRLMKDKDRNENKGFAFISFKTKEVAQKAIDGINSKEFKGKVLRCSLSQVKHRLFMGNIPKSWTEEELRKVIEENGPGIENLELLKDPQSPSRNRGFAFIEYYNHACAEYARQKMTSPKFKLDGNTPTVTWADPKSVPDPSAAAQVKALYVKNIPDNTTPDQLKEIFQVHGEVTKVVLPPGKAGNNKGGFGFIHYAERSNALKAVKEAEKYDINGQVLDVSLAKPQSEKKFDSSSNSYKGGLLPSYMPYSGYGFLGDSYGGALGAGYGGGVGQPMIYGRGPMPPGMQMVPMVLPDGRLGYVLQQPGAQAPPFRKGERGERSDRTGSGGGSHGRSAGNAGSEGNRGRRFRPY
ncbi:heterogeneous nuclear ribonucleoprotein Q-like [Aristolochia californica]|uniref:heterogeneous nuclear ribonucleoprotein Q-like n=1 Tax=Aristolochia californica TaxID=171875 RepID=UPI0035D932E3